MELSNSASNPSRDKRSMYDKKSPSLAANNTSDGSSKLPVFYMQKDLKEKGP